MTIWKMLREFSRRCGPVRLLVAVVFLFALLDAILQATVPAALGWVTNALVKDPALFLRHQLRYLVPAILVATVVFYLVAFTWHYLVHKASRLLGIRFQMELFEHLQGLSADFYQRHRVGEIATRLTADITNGVLPVFWLFAVSVWAIATLVISCVGMALFSVQLMLVFILFVVVFTALTSSVRRRVRELSREARDEEGRLTARLTETIAANALVRAFAQEQTMAEALRAQAEVLLVKALRAVRATTQFGDVLNTFICITAPLAVLFVGAYFVGRGVTVGALVAAYGYWKMANSPTNALLSNLTTMYSSLASMDRIFAFLAERPLVADCPEATALRVTSGEIRVQDVTFAYPTGGGEPVLEKVTFTVPARSRVALVGESGVGKSTLVQLLLRCYDPTAGQVLIDGTDLRTVTQSSLRRQLGLVMQDTILFSGSVRENMLFAKPEATDAEIITALEHAEAWGFVRDLPEGLDTEVSERGLRLSGGQRQRLSIARVFLKDPPIVIFDEATSSLDTITEKQIQETMKGLYEGRTAVIIAHRLSTVADCDRILLFHQGRLEAAGTHRELLASSPRYCEMCRRQFVSLAEAAPQPEPSP